MHEGGEISSLNLNEEVPSGLIMRLGVCILHSIEKRAERENEMAFKHFAQDPF